MTRRSKLPVIPPALLYNGNEPATADEQAAMVEQIAGHLIAVQQILGLHPLDPNTTNSPKRVAKYLVYEALEGRFCPEPDLREFPNDGHDGPPYEDVLVQRWSFHSTCAHHWLPFSGYAVVGIKFSPKTDSALLGLSKYIRLLRHFERRFQLQERLSEQFIDRMHAITRAHGCGIVLQARHSCVSCRGVREHNSITRTISLRGTFKDKHKAEFLGHVNSILPQEY